MTKRVTVYDISKRLGLSPSTVSRVLNNSSLISTEKKELILRTAEEMGYQKRAIKRQKGRAIINIRLFLPKTQFSYIHLFYDVAELIEGIQHGFGETRVNIITSLNDGDLSLFDSKKLGDIDGCIFAFTKPSDALEELLEDRSVPFILLNRSNPEHNYVLVDNLVGMDALVNAMYKKRGESLKPCYVGFSKLPSVSEQREMGVYKGCVARNIPFDRDKDVIMVDSLTELREKVLPAIEEHSYNGVFCFNDLMAVSLYQTALRRNWRVPDLFSLTGFDNSPMLQLLDQRIDTIEFSLLKLGKEAGMWLNGRIINRLDNAIQKALEGDYIVGETI
nr:LacI family DNA-binding transcriptional regulator [uncultured Sphaerochaeta sp.]